MSKRKFRWFFLITLVGLGMALVSVLVWLQPVRFNRTVWLAHDNTTEAANPRAEMLADLIQNKLKPGLTRPQVITLLGKPAQTLATAPSITFSYRVSADGYGVDSNWLDVEFDASGRLVKSQAVQT